MTTNTTTASGPGLVGKLGTWLMILATVGLGFVICVEMINILFYDPFSDERFLFKLAGSLASVEIGPLTYLMFGSLFVALMMGLPLAFVTGGLGVLFVYLVGDAMMLNIVPSRIFPMMTNSDLAAIPLFIFMASMLERAGLIEEMFSVVYKWMGGLSWWSGNCNHTGLHPSGGDGWGDRRGGCDYGHYSLACHAQTGLRP